MSDQYTPQHGQHHHQEPEHDTKLLRWAVYAPPGTPIPEPRSMCPLPHVDAPNGKTPILVVVSSSAALAAARDILEQHPRCPLVLWAWDLAENLAYDAEDEFPLVFGWPSGADVQAAYERGPKRSDETAALFELETAYGFVPNYNTAQSVAAARSML